MRIRGAVVVAVAFASLLAAACKGITTPSNNQSKQFSGTLDPRGAKNHTFDVSKTGEFTAKLTAWGPNSQILAGMAWTLASNDGTCTTGQQQNNFVILNAQAIFGQIGSGKYCVIIFDPGTLTATQNYTITISYP
jgi:hypothetical protein